MQIAGGGITLRILHYIDNKDLSGGGMQLFVHELAADNDAVLDETELRERIKKGKAEEGSFDMIMLHSLRGIDISTLSFLRQTAKTVLILHDYYLICERDVLINNRGILCPGPYANNCVYCYMNKFTVLSYFARPTQNMLIPLLKHFSPTLRYYASRRDNMKKVLENIDMIIAPTNKAKRIVQRFTGKTPVKVVRHFCIKTVCENEKREKPVFGFIGNAAYHKGFEFLNDAVKILTNKNIEILAYGNIESSHDSRIKLKGEFKHEELNHVLESFDVLIFPSVWPETWGRVMAEAASCGKYILASNMTAADEILDAYKGLVIFDHNNQKELAKNISDIYRKWGEMPVPENVEFKNTEQYRDEIMKALEAE